VISLKKENNKADFKNQKTIPVIFIEPRSGWRICNFKELKEYRDLFFFLVKRDIKVLYAQTVLGFLWAILQPLIQIVIFTIVFGKVAKVPTNGIPYMLFSSVAIIPWTYMSQAITKSCESLVVGQQMLGKVFFPRMIFPFTPILAKLVDFGISFLLLTCIIIYYDVKPDWTIFLIPFFVFFMVVFSFSFGLFLSAMTIRFRDVKHAMPFVIRMLMFTAPIVYSASSIPESYQFFYSLNPIVGIIEGFRACLLGLPVPWQHIWPGVIVTTLMFIIGALYFNRMERFFVDVI
jgi:lipopolysaccharide transport system permease protein